jgi:hypothetical protein
MTARHPVSCQSRSKTRAAPIRRLSTESPAPARNADSTSDASLFRALDCSSLVELAARGPVFGPAERRHDALANLAALAAALDDLEVRSVLETLLAEEHDASRKCATTNMLKTLSIKL